MDRRTFIGSLAYGLLAAPLAAEAQRAAGVPDWFLALGSSLLLRPSRRVLQEGGMAGSKEDLRRYIKFAQYKSELLQNSWLSWFSSK
jgi:hypothetical protein